MHINTAFTALDLVTLLCILLIFSAMCIFHDWVSMGMLPFFVRLASSKFDDADINSEGNIGEYHETEWGFIGNSEIHVSDRSVSSGQEKLGYLLHRPTEFFRKYLHWADVWSNMERYVATPASNLVH